MDKVIKSVCTVVHLMGKDVGITYPSDWADTFGQLFVTFVRWSGGIDEVWMRFDRMAGWYVLGSNNGSIQLYKELPSFGEYVVPRMFEDGRWVDKPAMRLDWPHYRSTDCSVDLSDPLIHTGPVHVCDLG